MESYVIRIYRRNEAEPERVVGLVEHPDNGAIERFSGMAELVNILLAPQQTAMAPATAKLPKLTNQNSSTEEEVTVTRTTLLQRKRSQ
ncbi:MAG: hypothetical protein ACYC9L_01005 [Sulfuricaulis sp.]